MLHGVNTHSHPPVPFVLRDINTHSHTHIRHMYTQTVLQRRRCVFFPPYKFKTNLFTLSSFIVLFCFTSHSLILPHPVFPSLCSFLCFFFFFLPPSLLGLQGLVNPVLHLAQLFDLDLALWYSPSQNDPYFKWHSSLLGKWNLCSCQPLWMSLWVY